MTHVSKLSKVFLQGLKFGLRFSHTGIAKSNLAFEFRWRILINSLSEEANYREAILRFREWLGEC